MAGMLPGVESARRRRFHGSGGGWSDSPAAGSSASSSGLFNSARRSSSSTQRISTVNNHWLYEDERLGGAAREARERLDERLSAKWKSQVPTRVNSRERLRGHGGGVEERREVGVEGDLQTEVFGLNKSGSKRFNWAKMSWKASEQDECAVCLDDFKVGETLSHLPCAHRFHSRCLVPWLENNAHCPCCRMALSNSFSLS